MCSFHNFHLFHLFQYSSSGMMERDGIFSVSLFHIYNGETLKRI